MHSPTLSTDFSSRSILARTTSPAPSRFACNCCPLTLLRSLCALFSTRLVCFQQLARSFARTPGWGVHPGVPWLNFRTRFLCLCGHPDFVPPFAFIHLQIPPAHPSICNSHYFKHLQVPFAATPSSSHLYKTPGGSGRASLPNRYLSPLWQIHRARFPFPRAHVIVHTCKGDFSNVSQ